MTSSLFIRAMHPKTEIRPDPAAISRILDRGWWGQKKIHGQRAQIHIPADANTPLIAYTRRGSLHTKALPESMIQEVRRLFTPQTGWNAIDCEWLKPQSKLFVFDALKWEDQVLQNRTYKERYELLPRLFVSPHVELLPVYQTQAACLDALREKAPYLEGLVFKSTTTKGFPDTAIIRCRLQSPP